MQPEEFLFVAIAGGFAHDGIWHPTLPDIMKQGALAQYGHIGRLHTDTACEQHRQHRDVKGVHAGTVIGLLAVHQVNGKVSVLAKGAGDFAYQGTRSRQGRTVLKE